ncbi:MAG: hypothetical protein IKL88_00060 [Erysipelotrichales bacterium]|nr:hypothetical protein [Erysipelotrichales bacterium]
MFYLVLAILSSSIISIIMRLSEKYVENQMGMFMANYLICTMLSYVFMEELSLSVSSVTFGLGVISGILYLVSFVYLKMNMKYNGIVLSSTFMKLGVLIPTLMAIVIFKESPSWTQVLGIILSILAIILIHFEKDSIHEGNKKLWLLVLLVISGISDSTANIFDKIGSGDERDMYLLLTFFFAFLLSLVLAIMGKKKITGKDMIFGCIIGIPNYFSARFLLLALSSIPAVLVYPMYSVATIVVISLCGVLLFHEIVSRKKKIALCLILVAMGLLNV